jgi:hypothetical protein
MFMGACWEPEIGSGETPEITPEMYFSMKNTGPVPRSFVGDTIDNSDSCLRGRDQVDKKLHVELGTGPLGRDE